MSFFVTARRDEAWPTALANLAGSSVLVVAMAMTVSGLWALAMFACVLAVVAAGYVSVLLERRRERRSELRQREAVGCLRNSVTWVSRWLYELVP